MAFDCSALAPTLLETELFGHVKGSFSGAIATKKGLFEAAHGGTVFLDEVGNLSLETQGKLLRVLETRMVRKVGDTREQEVDIRLISATSRDLQEMAGAGLFREDLYYRLNVFPINLPPLRERKGDIPHLATAFLERFQTANEMPTRRFTPEVMAALESHAWPGNVRELKNIVERMAILAEGEWIDIGHVPDEIRGSPDVLEPLPESWEGFKALKHRVAERAVRDLEQQFLASALEQAEGNVTRAADNVGMQRTQLHALLRRHGLGGRSA
jgi:DNA-binding NtrC family response regulator